MWLPCTNTLSLNPLWCSANARQTSMFDLGRNAVRVFNHQVLVADFALPHGQAVAYQIAKCDEMPEYGQEGGQARFGAGGL